MYPVNRFLSSYEFDGWTVSLHYKLPHQGWKIHVSATYKNYQTVLNHVVWLAEKMDFSFKFASSSKLVEKLLDTHSVRESGGKLITIYPKNQTHCLFLLKVFSKLLGRFPGPNVLSDNQFAGTDNISYRYGIFENKSSESLFYKGKSYEDKRLPYFVLPPFIKNDPFAKYVYPKKSNDSHWKNLHIEGAYKITLGGGIYYGTYLKKEPIVLKEGRFGIGIGTDQAIAKRKNECQILDKLQGKHYPLVLGYFTTQNNYYLILQKITGLTYYEYFATNGPVVIEKNLCEKSMTDFIEVIKNLISVVAYAHRKGIILRDINPANVSVDIRTLKVYFIDCADSIFVDSHSCEKIKTPWYTIPETKYNTYAEDWIKVAWMILDGLGGVNRNLCLANYTQVRETFSKVIKYQGFSSKWIAIIEKLYTEKNESTKVIQFLDDPQLKKVKNMINPNKMLNQLHLIEDELNSYLLESLSQRDRTLLEKFSKEPSKIVSKFIKNELQSFICQDNMLYLKSGSVYSPYVNGGAAGRLYILVILATKFKLTELFPQLEKFLSKFSGRYVKNATISSGAAGLGMLMLYAYAITGNKEYLQYAYKWNELIEVLSFSLSGKKVWANYQFESKLDESFNNGNAGIRYFQRLLMGENHEFKKGDKC